MTAILWNIIADFATTLNLKVAVGATSATLDSATDDDNVSLPSGIYFFTVDWNETSKEYIKCTLSGTSITSVQSFSRQGSLTTGFARAHRKNASVKITDFGVIRSMINALDGTDPVALLVTDLTFSWTTTQWFVAKNLTTTQRDALTPTNGALIYNTTAGEFQIRQGGAWATVSSGSTQPNASTTVAGKVEIATSAESIAGTDTGGTGALLSVLPSDIKTNLNNAISLAVPVWVIHPYSGFTAPTGFLLCDGAAVSRTTYADLFNLINPSLGTFTVTIASPWVFTLNSHGLVLDDIVYLTTTGALPTGLTSNTRYYVISTGLTANAFQLSTTKWGSAINTSGTQSGTHTLYRCPYGLWDGSTTFNVPNLKGSVPVGRDTAQTEFNAIGETGGAKTHTLDITEIPPHTHTVPANGGTLGAASNQRDIISGTTASGSTGGGLAHNNLQPYITLNYIIKT